MINNFVFRSFSVLGPSMEKTLYTNDRLIVDRLPVTWAHLQNKNYIPQRGDIIVFKKLSNESIEKITKIMLDEFIKRLEKKNIKVDVSDDVIKYISKVGFDDTYGARPLRRAIQSKIEDKFVEEMLDGNIKEDSNVKIDLNDDKIVIK